MAERLGMVLSKVDISRYSDGEINIQLLEDARGKDVFLIQVFSLLIQPTCSPANENIFEVFLLVSALKKASCKSVTIVFPYYGYSTLDMKHNQKIPIAAADVARMLEIVGVNRVAALELHTGQIQGFFSITADNIESNIVMIDYLMNSNLIRNFNNLTIVSPNADGVYRAKKFADVLISKTSAEIGLSLVVKEKFGDFDSNKMALVGDVKGSECIILDDIIDSANSLIAASEELYSNGAKSVFAFATHGVFSGSAIENLKKSRIKKIIITNTIPINKELLDDKFIILSSAALIAETIRRIHSNESLSEMFL